MFVKAFLVPSPVTAINHIERISTVRLHINSYSLLDLYPLRTIDFIEYRHTHYDQDASLNPLSIIQLYPFFGGVHANLRCSFRPR